MIVSVDFCYRGRVRCVRGVAYLSMACFYGYASLLLRVLFACLVLLPRAFFIQESPSGICLSVVGRAFPWVGLSLGVSWPSFLRVGVSPA